MPSKPRLRTYGRSKKIDSNYIPKPVSPFKITEASNVIDALFSKNIRKRISSPDNEIVINKKTRGRPRKPKPSELPSPVDPLLLNDDSLNIEINSTFDNLVQGPVYNQVNLCNKSSPYVCSSTDTSNVQSSYNTRKKKNRNYVLHSSSSRIIWEKSCNKCVIPSGKVRKKTKNPKKLKKMIKNVVINISDTTTDNQTIPKKLHSYLDKSINYSLIKSKQKTTSNEKSISCARKFTPIASTSKLLSLSNYKPDNIFHHGFRHLMRADNTPRYIHSSTPIISRNNKIGDKLNVSPISVTAKTRLNFTSNNSKSLQDSKKLSDISSIQYTANNTVNKNNASNVIFINSTIPKIVRSNNIENVSKQLIVIDDTIDTNSLMPIVENKVQSVYADEDKIKTNNSVEKDLMKKSFIKNDIKLNGKAVVVLDRHLDVLGINGDTSVICRFTNSKTDVENKRVPVVYLERLSISKYLKNHGLFVTSRSRSTSKNSPICSKSQSIIDESSSFEIDIKRKNDKRNLKSCISNKQSKSKKNTKNTIEESATKRSHFNIKLSHAKVNPNLKVDNIERVSKSRDSTKFVSNSEKLSHNKNTNIGNSNSKISGKMISSGNETDNEQNIIAKRNSNSRISARTRNSKNKISKPQITANSPIVVIELSNIMENTAKSMFSSHGSDIIENSINEVSFAKNFITTRRKKVQFNTVPITNNYVTDESTKPPNISSKIWERVSQSKLSLVRIEDCDELKKHSKVLKINDNIISRRKTHGDIATRDTDINLNRKSIFLKPGKKWFRSLCILRQTNLHNIEEDKYSNKGRKWRDSVYEVLEKQNETNGAIHEIGDESVVNDMKHKIRSSTQTTLGIRKSLKIVNISVKNSLILAEETIYENNSGYVPTLAHVSILESFDKLSLSTNVDDREETARQIILKRCGQTDPIPFDVCYSSRTLKKCRKIGEGVYGEVFMYKSLDNKCRVMKVIPIEGNLVVNGERQKKFEEIISEIIIASELSNLRINNEFCTNGYAELLQIVCVQGKYPQHLLDLWDLFDEERGSENDSPEIFTEDQLYIVLELANGGQDLEAYRFNNAEQSYALFVQIVCSLAVAESALQFEHRDMHWGNILISPTDEATTTFRLKGREFEVATRGVNVSVIDFTLSRMTYNNCCIYNDLALDPDLFTATGDYQFDIYRLMKQRNQNDWEAFEPYSNILWLDYTLEKMIGQVRYLRVTTKTHKTYIRRLSQIRKKILNYNSATELLNSDVFSNVFL